MRNLLTEHGTGYYRAGEGHYIARNRAMELDGTPPVILCCHGHGANSLQFMVAHNWSLGLHSDALVEAGFVIASIDAGGGVAWGGPTAMQAIDDMMTWLDGKVNTDRIGVMGWSMGGLTILNWSRRHPDIVAAALAWSPATDLVWGRTRSTQWQTELDAVYGANLVNVAGYNPQGDAALFRDLPFPIRMVTAADDPTTPYDKALEFKNAVNDPQVELIQVPAGNGHFPFGGYPVASTVNYFKEHLSA